MTEKEEILTRALIMATETLNTSWNIINGDQYIAFKEEDFIDAAFKEVINRKEKK